MYIFINREMISILNNLSHQIKSVGMFKISNCESGEYLNNTYKYSVDFEYIGVGTIIKFEILQREEEGQDLFTCDWYIDKGYCSQFLSEVLNKISNYIIVVLGVMAND